MLGLARGTAYLIEDSRADGNTFEDGNFGRRLGWYSTEAQSASPKVCRTFENERIHGYTLSPDATRIAVITSLLGNSPWRVFLHVLDRTDCAELNTFELKLPEQPRSRTPLFAPSKKYFDNVPFPNQFARSLAISPDNARVAVAYGISKGISGTAFFGLYSMSDGHRLATLQGDTFTPNLYEIFMLDIYSAREAPIDGGMRFSPDSRSLFASSWNIRQWDLSTLR